MVPNSKMGGTPWVGVSLWAFINPGKVFIRFDNLVDRVLQVQSHRP